MNEIAQMSRFTSRRADKQFYRVQFLGSESDLDKVMEFYSANITQALEFVLSDPLLRGGQIWENGKFVCAINRELP